MYPFLEMLRDEKEHTLQEAYSYLANNFNLSKEDREKFLPSGKQLVYHNRIGWARTYLKKANLLATVKRGTFIITPRGNEALENNAIQELSKEFLLQFPEFQEFSINKSIEQSPIMME